MLADAISVVQWFSSVIAIMYTERITVDRVRVLLGPDAANEYEKGGILNPAVAGNYLLYRAVGDGNYSRILAARLRSKVRRGRTFLSAEKMNKVVLEPEKDYEVIDSRHGGVEDPRVTRFEDRTFIMLYTGFGRPKGFSRQVPVIAVATSRDGLNWEKLGRIKFEPFEHRGERLDFNAWPNKDAVLFSEKINSRYVILHRPMFSREEARRRRLPWRAIWYAEADEVIGPWRNNKLLLAPCYAWENGGVGAGVPPIHLGDRWVHIYHGFTLSTETDPHRKYKAGFFVTPHDKFDQVILRSREALFKPNIPEEKMGVVPHVVFPTAVWQHNLDPRTLALFWGAADTCIVWGTLRLPGAVLGTESGGGASA